MKHFTQSSDWIEGNGYRKKKLLLSDPLPAQVELIQEVRFSKGSSMPYHYHRKQTEIFYVLADGHIFINNEKVIVSAGEIVVCEPGDIHGIPKITEDFGFLVLKINYDENDTVWL